MTMHTTKEWPTICMYVPVEAIKLNAQGNIPSQDRLNEVEDNTNPKKETHFIHTYCNA